ncbi:MAG: flagellar biosynthesis protein FlgD, partial [Deltaproteobacteria bacterium]|nr:flagellar biosynthesis protein FlgD [Deltaproteobacteria bacterium]
MAVINPITYSPMVSSADNTVSDGGKNELDAFFQLLLTQLQNQDPLNPMESTDMTAQLAQFSQLEQMANMNTSLDYLQLYMASLNNAQAVGF